MKLIIVFRDDEARRLLYFLRNRYKSKAELLKLAKLAIRTEAANQAKLESDAAVEKL
jgi:hypothetical protein